MPITQSDIGVFRNKLRTLEREIAKLMKAETSCCGITLPQCHILIEIEQKQEISIKELAQILELDKSTLSRNIDNMVNLGLLNRIVSIKDRRYTTITLTENGKETVTAINELCDSYYMELFKHIPPKKYNLIIETLDTVSNAMKQISGLARIQINNCCKMKGEKNAKQ